MGEIILGLSVLLVVVYLSAINWQRSVFAVFILLVIEGALRKWALPQFSDLLYFLKDLVLLGAYIRFFLLSKSRSKLFLKSYHIKIFLVLSVGWCIFQAFNPSLGSPIAGLFGLRGYLFYIPLMWLVPNLFENEEELYQALRFYLLLVIPVGVLGILQFFAPASSPINIYAGGIDPTAVFAGTDSVRITGTFPYISGYAVYLSVCFALLVPLLLRPQSHLWQWVSIAEIAIIIANSFMTGSRGVILFQLIYLIGFVFLTVLRKPSYLQHYVKRFALPAVVTVLIVWYWLRPAFDAFALRATDSDSAIQRITDSFTFIPNFQFKGLDGYGVGATHQAVSALRNTLRLPPGEAIPVGFESELGRIAIEIGPIGFFLWYGLRFALLWELFRLFWKLRTPFLQHLALAAFLTHLILFTGQLVVHNVFSIYYWAMAGFIILLPYLDKIEARRPDQPVYNAFGLYE
jgi:hypothetical protein